MALEITNLKEGDEVMIAGSQEYPKFFHVPGHKAGFVAKGMTGTVSRLYSPGESDHLDRSDGRNVLVEFSEPKKWRAHFDPAELCGVEEWNELDAEEPTPIMPTKEITLCDLDAGQECDRVEDFMTPIADSFVFTPDMPMRDAAKSLVEKKITGAPVVSEGLLVGVLTQFDFLYQESALAGGGDGGFKIELGDKWAASVKKSLAGRVSEAMSNPTAVAPGSDMAQVAGLMLRRRFNHLPVVEPSGTIVGILTSQDVLRHVVRRLSTEDSKAD